MLRQVESEGTLSGRRAASWKPAVMPAWWFVLLRFTRFVFLVQAAA